MPTDVDQPLSGLRVLDLSDGIAGGYATKLLTDSGADVRSIEEAPGDPLRERGATTGSFDSAGDGLLFRYLRTNQRALMLDFEIDDDRSALLALFEDCDVVLSSRSEGEYNARGIGPSALRTRNAGASWISISNFGEESAWADRPTNDFLLQAVSGSTASRGRPGLAPLATGGDAVEWMAGTFAALGVLAAARKARHTGLGQIAEISKLEAIVPTFTNVGSVWGHFSDVWALPPSEDVPSIEPTQDGWIGFCLFTPQQWSDFCLLIEKPEWSSDPELNHMMSRNARADEIRSVVRAYTTQYSTEALLEKCELLRVPAAPIGNGALLPEIDHFKARGVFVENPRGGFQQPRIPFASSTWPRRSWMPAQTRDEARRNRAQGDSGFRPHSDAAREEPRAVSADAGARPLDGVRILDLTAFWAGPYATFVLSCLGADVIHVESIQRPDGMRFGTQQSVDTPGWWEYGPTFHAANTGKRGLTLDLTSKRGVELLLELVRQSDALIENFSPRVLDQFGLSWERLESVNPKLVLTRMPAFGLDGPWRDRVGFAQTMEQVCGAAWLTAYPESAGEQAGPLTPRACADPLAGLHAAFATLLGLEFRDRTGRGSAIESAMVETLMGICAEGIIEYSATGTLLRGDANRSLHAAPQGVYACRDRDASGLPTWVAISVRSDAEWAALVGLLDGSELPSGTDSVEALRARHDEIDRAIEVYTGTRTRDDVLAALRRAGVPSEPVSATRVGAQLEPIAKSDFIQVVQHGIAGPVPIPSQPIRFRGAHAHRRFERAAPTLGQHNREILGGILGLSDAEIEALERENVIGTRPVGL